MVSELKEWKWSSYTSTAYATGKPPENLITDWLLWQFSEQRATAPRQRYRYFVADGMVKHDQPWRKLVGQIFLGSEKFVNRMQVLLDDTQGVKEIPRIQRYPGRPPLARLFTDIPDGDKRLRNENCGIASHSRLYPERNWGIVSMFIIQRSARW
jgi:hypothetical protein